MNAKIAAAATLGLLLLAGCSHSEDRRWDAVLPVVDVSADDGGPSLRVYSIPTVTPSKGKTRLRDLSEAGQQALIEAMARPGADPDKLRRALAMPLEGGPDPEAAIDRTQLHRTLIVSVNKGWDALPGDRLIRTEVTIRPVGEGDNPAPYEFTGYTIAATDNKVQSIADLETTSEASLSANLAPKLGGLGEGGLEGSLSRSHTTSAKIEQQYENLHIDIVKDEIVITRESERGLDVVGNTFVEFTLAPVDPEDQPMAYLATSATLYDGAKPLSAAKAALDLKPVAYLPGCPLLVNAEMKYMLRRIVEGREYYTEGKQKVGIVRGFVQPKTFELVRRQEAQSPLYQILVSSGRAREAVSATPIGGKPMQLLFDTFEEASRFTEWMNRSGATRIGGGGGPGLGIGLRSLPRGARYSPSRYTYNCTRGGGAATSS